MTEPMAEVNHSLGTILDLSLTILSCTEAFAGRLPGLDNDC